jgi:hypothetical protein
MTHSCGRSGTFGFVWSDRSSGAQRCAAVRSGTRWNIPSRLTRSASAGCTSSKASSLFTKALRERESKSATCFAKTALARSKTGKINLLLSRVRSSARYRFRLPPAQRDDFCETARRQRARGLWRLAVSQIRSFSQTNRALPSQIRSLPQTNARSSITCG